MEAVYTKLYKEMIEGIDAIDNGDHLTQPDRTQRSLVAVACRLAGLHGHCAL